LFLAKRKTFTGQGWRSLQEGTNYVIQKYFFSFCPYHVLDLKRACLLIADIIEGIYTSEVKCLAFSTVGWIADKAIYRTTATALCVA